jgi:hypothetical protein
MRTARTLSRTERAVAFCLALIWIAGGSAGIYIELVQSHWIGAACALAALAYGIVWARVAVLSRLLTWPGLFAPWRSRTGRR